MRPWSVLAAAFFMFQAQNSPCGERDASDLSERVQKAMGITERKADFLRPLSKIMASPRREDDILDFSNASAVMDELAGALNQGTESGVLTAEIAKTIHIDRGPLDEPKDGWQYGSCIQRLQLVEHMWSEAQRVRFSDGDRASTLARAAILLSVQDVYSPVWLCAYRFTREPDFTPLTRLDVAHTREVLEIFDAYNAKHEEYSRKEVKAMCGIDDLTSAEANELSPASIERAITAVASCWPVAADHPGHQWKTANITWALLNWARGREDTSTTNRLRTLLNEWGGKEGQAVVARLWFAEALQRVAPPPGRMVYRKTMYLINGRLVPAEAKE